jgi:riboflavin kinase / FMN adenylyltransferase
VLNTEPGRCVELIRGLHSLRPGHRGCVVTIGNFDGVHRGHRTVVGQLARAAEALGLPAALVTFEPQPQEFFAPQVAPARLTRLREKLLALRTCPVDRVVCLRFDHAFASLSPSEFIARLLDRGLGARYVVVGDDFRFGHKRQGDRGTLEEAGRRLGFEVVSMETCALRGRRISSTWVREALAAGDLDLVRELLGRSYSVCGKVARGDRRGRELGFPTANIPLRRHCVPLSGVYAVMVSGVGPGKLPGIANVGRRPTVDGTRVLLEVNLFDFEADIYGTNIQVEFLSKLREERRFDSIDALAGQIYRDAAQARKYFQEMLE